MPSEAQARIAIDKLLEEVGWRFPPDRLGRRENIICENRVTRKIFAPRCTTLAQVAAEKYPDPNAAVLAGDWASAESLPQDLHFERPMEFWSLLT